MNRDEPKTIVLFGVPFHDVTMDETLAEIDGIINRREPRYIATANLDFAAQASRDVELQRILMDAHMVLCDGTPLVWASRLLKCALRERVAGSDLTPRLMAHAAQKGYRIFFLGSDDRVLGAAKVKLEREYPGLQVCGILAPPYAKLLELDNDTIAAQVREARPDILLVALGAPKQEKWIYMNHRDLGVPCSVGIGASLDFAAGKFSRAPVWMQVGGLEWLFRLMQEPRRLAARYYDDFKFFVSAFLKQWRELRTSAPQQVGHPPAPVEEDMAQYRWIGRVDAAAAHAGRLAVPGPQGNRCVAVLELSGVSFMDSIALGLIMKGFKQCKAAGGGLILLQPSDPVRRVVETLKLDRLIPIAASMEEARGFSRSLHVTELPQCEVFQAQRRMVVRCIGDLTAATAGHMADLIAAKWSAHEWARFITVDLSAVHFIDSSGLDALVRSRALAQSRRGGRFTITGANANIRNVLALGRLAEPLDVNSHAA
ncbi:MAG TPA: WecB/TagA/CpsF family glycosyltransferase [Chthoniobacteraceae bacterium]|jgi:N-acetylglucosaminyldiphosphoundecaprenol N-acetyl-beta-D-mannosaminyltransferase|nr:WecB/TagA/CpsF family glycosyltransferase [Chthoniobacteraceae bacterium]